MRNDSAIKFPSPPKFADKYAEREYQKGRLALAFRVFAKLGFDEGVAGHITLRVSSFNTCLGLAWEVRKLYIHVELGKRWR